MRMGAVGGPVGCWRGVDTRAAPQKPYLGPEQWMCWRHLMGSGIISRVNKWHSCNSASELIGVLITNSVEREGLRECLQRSYLL